MTKTPRLVLLSQIIAGGVLAVASHAQSNLQITEVYPGLVGEDGTPTWIEVTNLGTTAFDLADPYVNEQLVRGHGDSSNAPPGMHVAPSQVKVIVMGITAGGETGAIDAFASLWGPSVDLYFTDGPGLNESAGNVAFHDGQGTTIDQITYTAAQTNAGRNTATLEVIDDQISSSHVGVRGAFPSNAFFNDDLGLAGNQVTLVGSPGVYIPEPTSLATGILGLTLTGLGRNRR
jgi:hypothetical protein